MAIEDALIQKNISVLNALLVWFDTYAKGQYTAEDCPFKDDHYRLTKLIWGTGNWEWSCGFCGKEEAN